MLKLLETIGVIELLDRKVQTINTSKKFHWSLKSKEQHCKHCLYNGYYFLLFIIKQNLLKYWQLCQKWGKNVLSVKIINQSVGAPKCFWFLRWPVTTCIRNAIHILMFAAQNIRHILTEAGSEDILKLTASDIKRKFKFCGSGKLI